MAIEASVQQGQRLIIRTNDDRPAIVYVWARVNGGVAVADQVSYERLKAGVTSVIPVGIPFEDVFIYEPGLEHEIKSSKTFKNWDRLQAAFRKP